MYAIYRSNLNMTPGKLAAQCGHAYHHALREAVKADPSIEERYSGTGHGTKICMYTSNEGQLMRAYREAKQAGIPCVMVVDRAHVIPGTAFDGQPILTAIGIGPCYKEDVAHITKRCTSAP